MVKILKLATINENDFNDANDDIQFELDDDDIDQI